jgi:hypothetical protein
MKNLITILAVVATGVLTIGADSGQSGGCANSGVHGELSTGATVDPNNPSDVNVNIGGKIMFTKRPLTASEKQEARTIAFQCGVDFVTERSEASVGTTSITRAKANCFRNLTYRYRVDYAHNKETFLLLKKISNSAFDEGYKSVV